MLPYKRYAGPTLLHLAASYLEHDQQSYRETVSPGGRVTGYQTPPGEANIDERALHHSTVWWMLTWLGSQAAALAKGCRVIRPHHAGSACHRVLDAVAPHKFRSPEREQVLRLAKHLLYVTTACDRPLPERFFPRFATRSGFG
ncbi:MAG: hypothetical protein NTY19_23525 [Planctomycetota bacterium]|nr:hypothetical protein [Planctomycetota bacterium]